MNIAVIGAGAAGISASHYLARKHLVHLYEAAPAIGGHVMTVMAEDNGSKIPVDMGFIVFNKRNYPFFTRFIDELGVEAAPTDMSFSYFETDTKFAYSGHSLSALFASRTNIINPSFWRMLLSIRRFSGQILKDLHTGNLEDITLGRYVRAHGYPQVLMNRYLSPMVRSIWSARDQGPENFPVRRFAAFFANHGLLSMRDRPQWMYIKGGSHTYVKSFAKSFPGKIFTGHRVNSVVRSLDNVLVYLDAGPVKYDAVVMACHADTTVRLLKDADELEKSILGAWKYTENEVFLHTDESFLPGNRRAWACWNYIAQPGDEDKTVNVHYWMNMLQNFKAAKDHIVSLNPRRPVPKDKISRYELMGHPQFTRKAVHSQSRLEEIQGRGNIYFCGSYHGNGFHEDAIASGVRVAQKLGVNL